VGWGALAPILYFIEYGIGLKPNAPKNELVWEINSYKRSGCEKFRFNGHVVDLVANPSGKKLEISVWSDGEFILKIIFIGKEKEYHIKKGRNQFKILE
jgi:hypothetical protein